MTKGKKISEQDENIFLICGLFKVDVISSDYTAMNNKLINE
jgi:hypothetical protein